MQFFISPWTMNLKVWRRKNLRSIFDRFNILVNVCQRSISYFSVLSYETGVWQISFLSSDGPTFLQSSCINARRWIEWFWTLKSIRDWIGWKSPNASLQRALLCAANNDNPSLYFLSFTLNYILPRPSQFIWLQI